MYLSNQDEFISIATSQYSFYPNLPTKVDPVPDRMRLEMIENYSGRMLIIDL